MGRNIRITLWTDIFKILTNTLDLDYWIPNVVNRDHFISSPGYWLSAGILCAETSSLGPLIVPVCSFCDAEQCIPWNLAVAVIAICMFNRIVVVFWIYHGHFWEVKYLYMFWTISYIGHTGHTGSMSLLRTCSGCYIYMWVGRVRILWQSEVPVFWKEEEEMDCLKVRSG